ncbi:hypothetical protein BGX38DRAFT_1265589 [Terfezia claveryi]|nr:hypothetical protein BGX38DRAFT_1265589 [Terfezia claveryi]
MSIPLVPHAGPNAQTTSQKPRATSVLQLQNSGKRPPLSKTDSEGPDVAQDVVHFNALLQIPDLPAGTEDEGSDLKILDDEEEVDGSDDEQGDYITEEEAVQYAQITLGEMIV